MACFLKTLGVRFLSEKTAAPASALCRHFSVLLDDSPDKALEQLRKLKEMLKLMWKNQPPCDVPAEYPETPAEFLAKHPLWYATAYSGGPPVPSPVEWQDALLMYDGQPCRSTKAGCTPYMRPEVHSKQLSVYGWPDGLRMNQLQRVQHMQDMSLAQHQEPAELPPWLKLNVPQRQAAVPGMQVAGVAPPSVGGGVVMMDVHPGLGAVAGASTVVGTPVLEDAAAAAPTQPADAAPAPGVAALFGLAPENAPAMEQKNGGCGPGGAAWTCSNLGCRGSKPGGTVGCS